MKKLNRSNAKKPDQWEKAVEGAFTDYAEFQRRAHQFEALSLNGKERREGFATYAPEVLPKKSGKPFFKPVWGQYKEQIAEITNWQCAYCECAFNDEGVAQVEHFRPKSLFPLSAYDWDNYLLACGGCNRPKSDKWPSDGEYIRPDHPNYNAEKHFKFQADGGVDSLHDDAELTITDFALRRRLLVKRRLFFIKRVKKMIDQAAEFFEQDKMAGKRIAMDLLKELNDPEEGYPYSTALRQYASVALKQALPGFSI